MLNSATTTKLFIAFLLGMVTVLGFAPFNFFLLPTITLALLFQFWYRSATTKQAVLLGFSFGMGLFLAGISWIYVSMHEFGGLPMPLAGIAVILLCAYLALYSAALGWVMGKLRHSQFGSPFAWVVIASALWVLFEWLRGSQVTGFPWLVMGYTQVPVSPLVGFAPLMGVYGVSLVVLVCAALLFLWLEKGLKHWRYGMLFGLIWLSGFALQQIQWVKPIGDPVSVSLLQGNIAQDMKWREDYVVDTMKIYADLVMESKARLVVTPEVSLPLFSHYVPRDYLDHLAEHVRKYDGDVLIGMAELDSNGTDDYYNTMFSFGTSPEQLYRKHHLVPFGEFIPFEPIFGWFIRMMDIPLGNFARGSINQQPLGLAGQKVAINICYEDVFGEEIIVQLPQATMLVNVSNDAWFGRSIGPQQHLQIAQMRSLETGRYMLRATNTGVTAIINERGEINQKIDIYTTAALHGMAQGFTGATPYVRTGNYLVLGLASLLLCVALISVVRAVRATRYR
ncbi:MAG: apolipoprotein N-acyltransferase [Betaproteobacteria bacterium]|nr:apolipoprotein N-acyltransferase [Betaproteobacteria bacterium]